MDPYAQTAQTWDKIAGLYQDRFMDLTLYNQTYDALCQTLPQNAKLLELGCGPGNITRYLLQMRPDLSILATDMSYNMLELAKKNNPGLECKLLDARYISQLNSQFDGVVAGFCMPYLSETDVAKLIKDAAVLLHTGGIFYLSFVPGKPEESGNKTGSSGDSCYFYYHRSETIQQELLENGFDLQKSWLINYEKPANEVEQHAILLARKS